MNCHMIWLYKLLLGVFYGMEGESFSSLLHDAYPMSE